MEKQNVCPVCRAEITVSNLKEQKKELDKLLKTIEKETKKKSTRDSVKEGEAENALLINS